MVGNEIIEPRAGSAGLTALIADNRTLLSLPTIEANAPETSFLYVPRPQEGPTTKDTVVGRPTVTS